MNDHIKWYFGELTRLMLRPIYFFTFMEKGELKDKPFSFILGTSWSISAFVSLVIFMVPVRKMIFGLATGLSGIKFLLITPVLAVMSAVFFFIIFLTVLCVMVLAILAFFTAAALALDLAAGIFHRTSSLKEMLRASYYSSGALVFLVILVLPAVMAKLKLLSFGDFTVGTNIVFFMMIIYLWGLWSIAVRKVYKISRIKSASLSLTVIILVILLQMLVSLKLLPKLERWVV